MIDQVTSDAPVGPKHGGKRVSLAPRSRKLMEGQGFAVANVEHYNAFTRRKHDLYGFIDLLCIRGEDIVGVQVTSWDNVGDRAKKVTEHENYERVKHALRIVVQGWRKVAGRWVHREVEL